MENLFNIAIKKTLMDILIKDLECYSLWKVSEDGLMEFAQFVANTNYRIHQKMDAPKTEIEDVYLHEKELFHYSDFYAVKMQNGEYIGAIRATLWDRKFPLPMDREFGVNINEELQKRNMNPPAIWHVARLAITDDRKKKRSLSLQQRSEVLKILLAQVFIPICKDERNILLAECDERFLSMVPYLNLLNSELVGKPLIYLASLTIPVLNTAKNLIPFLLQNRQYCYV